MMLLHLERIVADEFAVVIILSFLFLTFCVTENISYARN